MLRVACQRYKKSIVKNHIDFTMRELAINNLKEHKNGCSNKAENSTEWMKKNSIDYPTLIDSKGELGRLFGAKSTPHVFVIDRQGKLVYHGAVDDDPNGQKQSAERQQYLENAIKAALNGQAPERSETRSYGCSVKYK